MLEVIKSSVLKSKNISPFLVPSEHHRYLPEKKPYTCFTNYCTRFLIYGDISELSQYFFNAVNGSWSAWSAWQACSATCGDGLQLRTRVCKNPEPSNGGYSCEGDEVEVKPCTVRRCRK